MIETRADATIEEEKPDLAVRTEPGTPPEAAGVGEPAARVSWWVVVLGLVGCAVALLLLERYIGVYMPDDAYITYRYAENLAAGKGLVFNAAAAPVEGYSNLSWIVLLAGLSR